ncbi:MAG: hypothetical protein IJA47_05350 [Oscillospiraceae bacterium]|nr:hypothetical protein [Oscillospiraceae bacterium]
MFNNIGGKIKTVAMTLCIIESVVSAIYGLVLIATDKRTILPGILLILIGPIIAWLGSFLLYGFGQLIENSDILVRQGYLRKALEQEEEQES